MKLLRRQGIAWLAVACFGFSNPVWAGKVQLQCQTLTSQGRASSVFNADQTVDLRLKLFIPNLRIQKNATFSIKGIAQKGGLKLPYKIDSFEASAPVGRDGLDLELTKRVKVPDILSGSDIDLQVATQVEGFRAVKCTRHITVR